MSLTGSVGLPAQSCVEGSGALIGLEHPQLLCARFLGEERPLAPQLVVARSRVFVDFIPATEVRPRTSHSPMATTVGSGRVSYVR